MITNLTWCSIFVTLCQTNLNLVNDDASLRKVLIFGRKTIADCVNFMDKRKLCVCVSARACVWRQKRSVDNFVSISAYIYFAYVRVCERA